MEINKLLNENTNYFKYSICIWMPIFSDEELYDILEKVILINPGHPLIAEPILIGKN